MVPAPVSEDAAASRRLAAKSSDDIMLFGFSTTVLRQSVNRWGFARLQDLTAARPFPLEFVEGEHKKMLDRRITVYIVADASGTSRP